MSPIFPPLDYIFLFLFYVNFFLFFLAKERLSMGRKLGLGFF